MENEDILREFVRKGFLRFGQFKLSSGKTSWYYINLRELYYYPELARKVAKLLFEKAVKEGIKFDIVAGVATAGIPLATYFACVSGTPMVYIRKESKGHGLGKLVEGGSVKDKRVLVLDDIATTGGTLAYAISVLRSKGGIVDSALVVIDRQEGAREKLEEMGVRLYSLFTSAELLKLAYSK